MLREIVASIETSMMGAEMQREKDKVRELEVAILLKYPKPVSGPFLPFPGYADHIKTCRENFLSYASRDMRNDTDRTWGLGDSIMAGSKDRLTSIRPKLNMAKGGMWAHHILQVAMDMESMFKAAGFVPKNIVVGTPGGNNFLNRQDVPTTIGQVTALLNYLRKTYPEAKIIIYGLPAPISMYVIQCRPAMMGSVRAWQKGDRNCVLLLLEKNFVAAWKYLPKGYMSSDGIHFTPTGQIEYDKDIIAGKKALPGMVIL